MKQRRQRKKHRFFAAFLCFCVLFTMPGIQNVFPVIAAGQEESFQQENIITAFEPLSEDIKLQTVFTGIDRDELYLPEELTVYLLWESSEQEVGDSEQESIEQENTGETDNIEENSDTETKWEQDTQPEESNRAEETDETAVTDSEDIDDTKDEENSTEESGTTQETHTVTMQEYHAENVISVQTLENTQTEKQEETVTIDGVTWQSEPEYDGSAEGIYTFTAVLPEGYALAEGVSLPQITVTVKESESGTDFAIQTLLDRIAALPDAEENLALEPDMEEDEDAYAEWEEKLYEYAEEALAIWEEYEVLTEEQQARMPEKELAKLMAWVELAETLAESSQVMTADDASHTHCICGRNMYIGDHTAHNTGIEYKLLTINDSGQLLINGEVKEDAEKGYTLTSGYYYLQESQVTEIGTITIDGNVTLCLNGGTLKHMGETGSVIVVSANSTFTLCDCKNDSGCIMAGKGESVGGGGIFMYAGNDSETTFNMFGGVIKENQCAVGGGGGIYCDGTKEAINPKVNIYGGKIIDNSCGGTGGGINAAYAQVNIFGGSIEGNKASRGGGINLNNSNIEISNASIINNTITDANYGGGVFSTQCKVFSISGTVNISGNTDGNKKTSNVFFRTGLFFDVTDSLEGSCIGVTVQKPPTQAKPTPVKVAGGKEYGISTADWSCFFSDKDGYEILWKETTEETDSGKEPRNELWLALPGSCDLGGLDLSASGATLSPSPFDPSITEYTSTVANTVNQVDITATLASTASGADIKIKINDKIGNMENGKPKTVDLSGDKKTIEITVTSGELSKTYTIEITKEANNYTVTYNGNGSTGGSTADSSHTYGTAKALTANGFKREYTVTFHPNYTGSNSTSKTAAYTFAGWNTEADGSGTSYDDKASVENLTETNNGTVTLYAQWTPASVTYTPTREGYTFAGWYADASCSGSRVDSDGTYTPIKDMTLYAKWTPIGYIISYNLDGGTVTGNPIEYTIESNAITLNNPTKEGYTFTGWSGTDLTGSNNMRVTIASGSIGHRTYTANWELKGYTVTLHTNGGTGGTDLTSYKFGSGAVLPTNWKKTGYVFDGWYEDDSCTGTAITNISGTDTGDKEYWAKWTDNIAPVIGTLGFNYQPKNFWHWLIGKDSLVITVPVTEEGSGADKITYTVTQDGGTAETKTANITGGEAKITVDADFKGTVSIVCTDKAGNTSAGVTVGAGVVPNGIIIEDNAPQIAFQAANAELLNTGEYKTAPNITVTVTDDKDNAISGGIASVSYQVNGGSAKKVPHDYTTSMVVHDSFTIPASEIPANGGVITVIATDNAGNSITDTYTVKVHTHSGTLVPAVAPTCTTAGNKEYYTCTCGKLFSDSSCTSEITDQSTVVLNALGHHFEGEPYIVSTTQHWRKCSRCSVTEQKGDHTFGADDKCTVCGYVGAVDPGHTHSGTLVRATEPTCTLPGNIAYYSCSSCGKLFSDSGCTAEITEQETKIKAWGHDFVIKHDQNQHWQQCSRCSLEQSSEPHVYDNDTDTDCNVCSYVRTIQHTHSATLVPAKPATCTEDGHEAYYTCSCGKWFSDSGCVNEITDHASVTVGKLGHNFVGQYLFDANGHWKVCSRCNTAQTAENHVFDDDSDTTCNKCGYQRTIGTHTHSVEKTVAATEPTCTTAGNRAYYVCSCGKWFSDSACTKEVTAQTVTAALGHDYGDYNYDEYGHWKVCRRCGAASVKHGHNYDNHRDTKCNDCGWVRAISDSGQDEQPTPTPSPTEKPDNPGTVPGMPDNSQPEDKQEPESTGTPEPTEKPSETGKEQQPEGDGEQTVPASIDNGKIAISGEPVATGNAEGMTDTRTVLKLGNGAVIVTVVCAEQEYTAGVADTLAVANAVLTPEQIQLVNNGETIEIRIDVKDISDQVPEQDKEVIENGIEEYRKEVSGLVLGMYVDISMFIRIGEGDWNAITTTKEPVEIIIGIPEELQEKDRAYYIIRAHDGVPAFMNDMDDDPSTITVSTDLFSSYAIAYVQAEGTGHKCGLCHICPTFLGICCFVWLAIIILIMIVVIILLRKKKEEQEARDTRQ